MRRAAPKREGRWTAIPDKVRKLARRTQCQVCGERYGEIFTRYGGPSGMFILTRQSLDHLIPRRWLEARNIDPHQERNILSVCGSCHGAKKTIEDRLFRGDAIGWLLGLRQIGYPIDQVVNFGISVGLNEFKRLAGVAAART
jgi:hypothetical protein